jgi:hypothetical protein
MQGWLAVEVAPMRTAQAVEISLCIGVLVGAALGLAAGVGLVVKKPDKFGLVHVGSGPLPGTYTSGPPKSEGSK